ncbi:hypothetical protein BDQ94DRAFT_68618 [Aspergillus welwitschiae]|uniref:Uncharacterized protein n=1 Tax=Aspergillus welwitschiae TaxID=1341132 RepID=A0A3F3PUE0_9EURO|nr:hypothetical protein BDQ94DRAFT_68618 [Aspergillus welwitschiae]RDH30539.1 hypothetical protein BDQ94DRAFT_68618 [Aspergillus welwitschiae]
MRDGVVVAVCRFNGCTYWGEGEKKREIWCGGPIPPLQTIQSNKRMVWVVYSGCVWKLWCNAGPGLRLLFSISLDYLKYHPISFLSSALPLSTCIGRPCVGLVYKRTLSRMHRCK